MAGDPGKIFKQEYSNEDDEMANALLSAIEQDVQRSQTAQFDGFGRTQEHHNQYTLVDRPGRAEQQDYFYSAGHDYYSPTHGSSMHDRPTGFPPNHDLQAMISRAPWDHAEPKDEKLPKLETGEEDEYYTYDPDNDLDYGSDTDLPYVETQNQPRTQFPDKVRDWEHYLNIKGYKERDLRKEAAKNPSVMPPANVQRQLMRELFDAALDCSTCQDPIRSVQRVRMETGYYPAKDIEMLCWDSLVALCSSVNPELELT